MGGGLPACACATCFILTVTTVILIILGFSKLQVNEVGIDYSSNSLTLNTKTLYTNGIVWLGIGHSFIKYPRNQLELNMEGGNSIVARTNDGLVVTLQTKILYKLEPDIDKLASLYLMFKEDFEIPIENICRSVIRDVASEFTAFQFWSERENITTAMQDSLTTRLDDIFVRVETFLLSAFILPKTFQDVIDKTEVQKQEMNKVVYELERVNQETQATILQAEEEVLQIETLAIAAVAQIQLEAESQIFKLNVSIAQEIKGYKNIKDALDLTTQELTTMIWLEKMSASRVPKTIMVKTPEDMLF